MGPLLGPSLGPFFISFFGTFLDLLTKKKIELDLKVKFIYSEKATLPLRWRFRKIYMNFNDGMIKQDYNYLTFAYLRLRNVVFTIIKSYVEDGAVGLFPSVLVVSTCEAGLAPKSLKTTT